MQRISVTTENMLKYEFVEMTVYLNEIIGSSVGTSAAQKDPCMINSLIFMPG